MSKFDWHVEKRAATFVRRVGSHDHSGGHPRRANTRRVIIVSLPLFVFVSLIPHRVATAEPGMQGAISFGNGRDPSRRRTGQWVAAQARLHASAKRSRPSRSPSRNATPIDEISVSDGASTPGATRIAAEVRASRAAQRRSESQLAVEKITYEIPAIRRPGPAIAQHAVRDVAVKTSCISRDVRYGRLL